ncbi:NAD(P)H-hydrate epimerase [Cryobacterium sp. 10I5]|uniref:NAD(P)H-hydrate epimerase n=1 Tax=Cryobacterium sp. 10I5 TaxID=3048581 RepID=UPI002B22AE50|nr:NAD(P)H-hydrate epimerase [Cryobacterium sp. 10I5]MEB0265422.1 NAD(P)H-hydrate epimerase [Cryobacterium sp. 10I5]
MKTYTAAQQREAEQPYLAAGIPLMQRASTALAAETAALLVARRGRVRGAGLLVLAGTGNNGGDALFAAASLAAEGARVIVVPTARTMHEEGLAAAVAAGARVLGPEESPALVAREAASCDVILDGILGTGTSTDPALRGRAREVVAAILAVLHPGVAQASDGTGREPVVVAVDLPSGVGVDDGAVPDPTVLPATVTVTFGGCKPGLLRWPAAGLAGRVVVADIGIAPELERIAARDRAATLDG